MKLGRRGAKIHRYLNFLEYINLYYHLSVVVWACASVRLFFEI